MAENFDGQWFPVVTLLIGFSSSAILEFLRDARTNKQATRAVREDREAELKRKREEFQLENILELQDLAAMFLRSNGEVLHQDEMEFRKSGKWRRALLPEELNLRLFNENGSLLKLATRLQDEEARNIVRKIRAQYAELCLSPDLSTAKTLVVAMADDVGKLNERIGNELRRLHGGE